MPETLTACRCGKPLIATGTGAAYCEHCDRGCATGSGKCAECRIFLEACDPHCGCKG